MNRNEEKCRRFLTLKEMMIELETRPEEKFLWGGIKEKSFGLVFGPPKSGKTIFCENLAMKIAIGEKNLFGYELDGIPKKVLFVGLEEYWVERARRNKKQLDALNDEKKLLLENNYLLQSIDFTRKIVCKDDYKNLENMIVESKAEVVIIDSITRLNHGKLEQSETAEKIMQTLRNICYDNNITLVCIHHTPKMKDEMITMDKIKGSSTFAQEADFAIGVNCTSRKNRYLKEVFYRYASDSIDSVKEFSIQEDMWLNYIEDVEEETILRRTDMRRDDTNKNAIKGYINENSSLTFQTNELVDYFNETLSINERRIKDLLKELTVEHGILKLSRGIYASINYTITSSNGDGRGI